MEGAEELPGFQPKFSYEAKLTELLRNITSTEVELCSDSSKEFVKLLKGDSGGEFLREYVKISSNCSELLQAWKVRQGKTGLHHVFTLITAIFSHVEGKNDVSISKAFYRLAHCIIQEKLDDIYKEINSKEAKHQNAALLLLASIARRGSGLASDLAKIFDFKLPILPKLAEFSKRKGSMEKKIGKNKHSSTRKSFVRFAMSFLEVGKPGLLRWVLQQREIYSGVLRGLGSDDDQTVVYIMSTLRDKVLVPESLMPPGLRSVLFGSVTLEQLVDISGRGQDGELAAEVAYSVLLLVCTDPSNGLMPDSKRYPNPLRGNPKRLLDLMKKLKATENEYHRDLLLAIVKGRPLFGSAYMDSFPYHLEDHSSSIWFPAASLAANVISSVGMSIIFDGFESNLGSDGQTSSMNNYFRNLIRCISPRSLSRLVLNKGLLHSDFYVKHGSLRLVLEQVSLLDSFLTVVEQNTNFNCQAMQEWVSLKQVCQNEIRILLPDPQVLLSLLSSLSGHYQIPNSSLKRPDNPESKHSYNGNARKKQKIDISDDEMDIQVAGISSPLNIVSQCHNENIEGSDHELDKKDDQVKPIEEVWGLQHCSEHDMKQSDEDSYLYSKLLDVLKLYLRRIPTALDKSFDFFKLLPPSPSAIPTIVQRSLLSLFVELIGYSPKNNIAVNIPPLMYKHLNAFIDLILYSSTGDIKEQAIILAGAAMLSTGAFDRCRREINAWLLFLPGYSWHNKFPIDGRTIKNFQALSPAVVSFLCDAVSSVGNNLFKYSDLLRSNARSYEGAGDVLPDFSSLVICVLEKCMRVLASKSGAFSVSDKLLISIYVCCTLKYLLQTQVEAGLLSSLIEITLSERLEDDSLKTDKAVDMSVWKPLKNLLLFSRSITNHKTFHFWTIDKGVVYSDTSFLDALKEVKRFLRTGLDGDIIGTTKAFVFAMISAEPDVVIRNLKSILRVSESLLGVPFSLLFSVLFLDENILIERSIIWSKTLFSVLEKSTCSIIDGGMNCETQGGVESHANNSDSVPSHPFLRQVPFYVLFPAVVSDGGIYLLEHKNLRDFLWSKLSEWASIDVISCMRFVLFWLHKVQTSYRVKRLNQLEQLSEICFTYLQGILKKVASESSESDSSNHLLPQSIIEVAQVIFCHPVTKLALEHPLGSVKEIRSQSLESSWDDIVGLGEQYIHKMDHDTLLLLFASCESVFLYLNSKQFKVICDSASKQTITAFKNLIGNLDLILREKFDQLVASGDLKPIIWMLQCFFSLTRFMSPFELLNLANWVLSRIDLNDTLISKCTEHSSLFIGLSIAGRSFDMLSDYLERPYTEGVPYNLCWDINEKGFDVILFESIFFQVIQISLTFELDAAYLCLLKAFSAISLNKTVQNRLLPQSMAIQNVLSCTSSSIVSSCIHSVTLIKSRVLSCLVEMSPFHLSLFGHLLYNNITDYSLQGQVVGRTSNPSLSDDQFVMLLPATLSYVMSVPSNFPKQLCKCLKHITSFYCKILLHGFSNWKNYVSTDLFKINFVKVLEASAMEVNHIVSDSLLGKAIVMLRYAFSLNKDSLKLKKRIKLFDSVCLESDGHDAILETDAKELQHISLDKSLNLVNRVVAKIHLCKLLLFPECDPIESPIKEDNVTKNLKPQLLSCLEDTSRSRFMDLLINSWQFIVKMCPTDSVGSEEMNARKFWIKFLEAFLRQNILELMQNHDIKVSNLSLTQIAKFSLLHRFGDPETLKMLRDIVSLQSDRDLSITVLQLLLAHSEFTNRILSCSTVSGRTHFGMIFKPNSSILKSLARYGNQNTVDETISQGNTEQMKLLEVIKLLRVLFYFKQHESSSDSGSDTIINLKEMLILLLSAYGATDSEIDMQIYCLIHEIESSDESISVKLAEVDYLWGEAATKVRRGQDLEKQVLDGSESVVESVGEQRRRQFRENHALDPKLCANTVLHFPYSRTVEAGILSLNKLQQINSDDTEKGYHVKDKQVKTYDPVFIFRFSIHSLAMEFIEAVEFASMGLLAIAFVGISSPDSGIRKLAYEVLGRFKTALESQKGRKGKGLTCLRLLLTHIQNGIEEPWERISSVTAMFAAEASFVLLDPSHDHYSAICKMLMQSSKLTMKGIPLFEELFWSSSVKYKEERLFILRLLYAGMSSNDDAHIYIRNNILETMLGFYTFSDNESKELILQVIKKSIGLPKIARHLVEHCGLVSWLSSAFSPICENHSRNLKNDSWKLLTIMLEITNNILSSSNICGWLQKAALEQLSELSTHLYRFLVHGGLKKEKANVIALILQVLLSTTEISQKREIYQPHFTLSSEGLFQIYEAIVACESGEHGRMEELGLKVVLMCSPPTSILNTDPEKCSKFVMWAVSVALQSNSRKTQCVHIQPNLLKEEEVLSEDSLASKLLRWLTASVIHGMLSLKFSGSVSNHHDNKSDLRPLNSLMQLMERRLRENLSDFGCEDVFAASILHLQLLCADPEVLPSVVWALSLLRIRELSIIAESANLIDAESSLSSVCSRISCPVEANPNWRWLFDQAWKDPSTIITDTERMDEFHACQTMLILISNSIRRSSGDDNSSLSHQDMTLYSNVFKWERSFLENE
ncbi:uncharacterized protein LOC124941814 [Impatiens glandulifera]|uniref:uncharacterized protein LOC124941814 n=1 Tax=Impatiens glandulifera TaxID=253017 RepID=UPI001FB15C8D|nr:uncharacterized protein LOC124941814 [Impatiens glandulifera]